VLRRLACVCLLLLGSGAGLAADPAASVTPAIEIRQKFGDDPRWASPDFDDQDWKIVARIDGRPRPAADVLPARAGIFWIRYRMERSTLPSWGLNVPSYLWPADEPGAPVNSVFLAGSLSYEFYWDGRLIGQAGRVGASRAGEVAGPLDNLMLIPDSLLGPGPHVVAIRASTYHYNFPAARFRLTPILGNYAERLRYEARQAIVPIAGSVSALLAAIVCAALYWGVERRRVLLICGLLALTVALMFTLIGWRWLHNDPYPWLYPRYLLMLGTMAAIGLLAVWLLVEQFNLGGARWWLLGALVPLIVIDRQSVYLQVQVILLGRLMMAYALLPATWAAWQRRPGAIFAVGALLFGMACIRQDPDVRAVVSPTFFLFFGVVLALILGALGWQIRADRRRAQAAQLAATRLELELLKKNIQPHFLLNTLTVLAEVVEQDPPRAAKLIDDLADEFRTVARISAEKLIPLAQEIELCRTHLRVMSARTARDWQLEVTDGNGCGFVPPALFLTLIENGFAHQRVSEQTPATFRLTVDASARETLRCVLLAPGEAKPSARPPGGTGLRYVKARLEEGFPGRWKFANGPVDGGWQTVIEIPAGADGHP